MLLRFLKVSIIPTQIAAQIIEKNCIVVAATSFPCSILQGLIALLD